MTANWIPHRVPLLPVLLAYVAGVLVQVYFLQTGDLQVLWLSLSGLCLLLLPLSLFIGTNLVLAKCVQALLLFASLLLGVTLTATFDIRNNDEWFGKTPERYESFIVEITESPKEKARTVLLPAKVKFGLRNGKWSPLCGQLPVYVYQHHALPHFQIGQRIIIPADVVPLRHNNNPGSFDLARKQQREGRYFQSFVSHSRISVIENGRSSSWLRRTRAHLLAQLDTYIHDPAARSIASATLLNEAGDMDPQMRKDYAATGISHIIVISGMHVNLLFGLIVLPLFWIRGKQRVWLKYLAALPFVWLYVALCDFPPSAVRAAVGFTLLTVALLSRRPQYNIHLLTLNAFLLLLCDPMWLFHIGVQLSFLAVLSIFIFYPVIRRWYSSRYIFIGLVWDTIAVSLSVQVLVFPLVIYYFHQFPIWFLPANLVAALFSLLQMTMAFGIMIFGVLKLSSLAYWTGLLLERLTRAFNTIISWFNAHSWDLSRQIPLDGVDYFLLMCCIILLSVHWLRKKISALLLGLGLVLIFVVNMILQNISASRQERIIVYAGMRQSCTMLIKGRSSWLYTDSLTEPMDQFALKPARLHFRVEQQEHRPLQNVLWRVGDKQIVFVHDSSNIPALVPDVFILSKDAAWPPEAIPDGFQRSLFVLDGSFGRSASLRYAKDMTSRGFKMHNVQTDGAWWHHAKK